jgi:outer membrane protein assembly factor BamD (BamD/ComL family)
VQRVLEDAAERTIETGERPGRMADLLDLDLPRRLAVRAGIRGAELYYARGSRLKAFRLLQRVDRMYPHHHERARAGALLADIGFSFADDKSRYMLFFTHEGHATEVLEYLVLNYPTEPRGDQAYARLAQIYEGDRLWRIAIDKHQDLVLWYPDSPLATPSKARIPHLRLTSLGSPEFDRDSLEIARGELEAWLDEFSGHELERDVRLDLTDCMRRLADSDLTIARFYRKVDNLAGAEWHARRAVTEARDGLDPDQLEEAQALLDDVQAIMEEG